MKQSKLNEKARQYDARRRALEDQNYKLQQLVKEQHSFILVLKSELEAKTTELSNGKILEESP